MKLKIFFLVFFCVFFASNMCAQTSYLGLDGGFEGTATIDNTNTFAAPQTGKWTKANATQTISNETSIVRSGANSLKVNNSSTTGRRVWSPNFTFASTTSQVTVQYYIYVANITNGQEQQPGIQNNTEGLSGSYTTGTSGGAWTKVSYSKASSTYTSMSGLFLHRALGTGGDMYVDDMCVYTGAVDTTQPNSATGASAGSATASSLTVGWTAASGGVDGGGYMVVRYTTNPNADNDPLVNGIYNTGNTYTLGTGSLVGTVVYVGTGTSFTDSSLAASTTYYYKVYTFDKAYNYAAEVTCNGTTTSGSTVDGSITAGEYGTHTNGNNQQTSGSTVTYMKWDATNLYVGVSGASLSEGFVMYLDKDPQTLVNGGTNANGTNVGNSYDGTNFAELQYRADLVMYVKSGYREYRTANGSNGWSAATTGFGSYAESGTVREFSIPWSVIGGMPSAFNFFSYVTSSGGFVYGQLPPENAGGNIGTSARYPRYYTVSTTAIASPTPPFSRNSYVFNSASDVTSFGAISVYDFTMNTSGRYLSRTGSTSGNWTIAGNLNVGAGTVYLGSGGGSYGNTTVAGNLNVSGGSFNMDQTTGSVSVSGNLNITGGSYDMGAASGGTAVTGSVSVASGASLILSTVSGGDISVGGDWTIGATATQTNNSRAVRFNGASGNQNIIKTGGGTVFFDYLLLDKAAGNVTLNSATDVTLNSTSGNVVQFLNAGNLDLNGRSLTLNNAGGSLFTNAAGRKITSATAAQVNINANKSISYNNSGTDDLTFDTNITVHVTNAAIDFGAGKSYINGTLQLNANGGVTNAPIYGSGSTLKYWYNGSGSVYGRYNEWNAVGVGTVGTTKGYPFNVQISNTTVLDLGANSGSATARALGGTLTIDDGAKLDMAGSSAMSQPLTVGGDLILGQGGSANLTLSSSFGGDLKVGGNISFTGTYNFVPNNRSVYFIKNGTQTVTAPVGRPSTFNYITFQPASGSTTLQLVGADMTIAPTSTGDLLTFNSSADVFDLNGRSLTLGNASFTNAVAGLGTFKGNIASSLTLVGTGSIGTLRFTAGSQFLGTLTMTRQNGVIGATLGNDLSIATALVLTNGIVDLNGFNMTLGSAATTSGASANSFVIADTGELRKTFTTGASFTFPVGDNTAGLDYSPATLNFTLGSFSSAYAGVKVVDAKQPNNTAPTNFITRYWAVSSSGITSAIYNFSGTYTAADINGSETACDSGRWDGSGWTLGSTLASNTVSISGLTTLPTTNHFTGGNPLSPPEIDLQGNSVSIASGDTTPSTADHTDFGSAVYGNTVVRTFTIRNLGASALSLTGTPRVQLTGSGAFAVTTQPAAASIAASGSLTFQITYTAGAYTAQNATVTILNNDSDEGTYTFAITGVATPNASSDIIANATYAYNSNIAYVSYQSATITNTSNSIDLFKFDIRDGGATAATDNLPTTLNNITFNVTNTSMIRSAALFNGNALVNASPTINTSLNTISFASVGYSAADGTTAGLTLRVTFQATVTDNTQFQVTISNANVTVPGGNTSSSFSAFTSVVSSTTGNRNRIVVTADRLAFVQQPSTTAVSSAMTPAVTVAGVDALGNRDTDYAGSVSMTSTGTLTGSPVTATAALGVATFSTLTHTGTGTFTLTATTTGLGFSNTVNSNSFTITAIIYANNDFRSKTSGTWTATSGAGTATWEQYSSATNSWSTFSGSPTGTATVYIANAIDIPTAGGSYGGASIKILNGGTLTWGSSSAWTAKNMYVYTGGTLQINTRFTMDSAGTFEVEDGATVNFNYGAYSGTNLSSSLWNGTENFHPSSTFVIQNQAGSASDFFIPSESDVSANAYNGFTAVFGNLIFDSSGTATYPFFGGSFTKNLTHGDFIFRSTTTSSNAVRLTSSALTTTIGGNFTMESGFDRNVNITTSAITATITVKGNLDNSSGRSLAIVNQSGTATVTFDVEGNVTIPNAGTINLNSTSGVSSATGTLGIKGDLNVGTSGLLLASTTGGTVNFKGTGDGLTAATTQTIDIASTGATENQNVAFSVSSGAYVQLANRDLELGNSGKMTVTSGGVLDFGFASTTPLVIKEVSAGATSTVFALNSGGTLKITSPSGITASGSGNVQTDSRTYTQASSTFHYIGKSDQVTGDGITTSSNSKTIICELDTDALQLSLTNSTAITTPGLLNIKKGKVIETTGAYITGSTGGLTMEANTLYRVAALSSSGTDLIPRLDGISNLYTLNGGTIELNGAGSQILRGARDYRNLTFSNTGTKTVSTAVPNITGTVTVSDSVILDVSNNTMGGVGTNLTLANTAQYKTAGAGSKPDAQGAYAIGSATTVEFYGTSATTIRLGSPISYGNVVINGTNVSNISSTTGIRMQSGTTFTVKNGATFRLSNTNGFTGATSTAVDNTNSPTVTLETGSTVDYAGASQSITPFSPYYYNLKMSGSGTKTIPGTSEIWANNNLTVSSGVLQIDANKLLTVTNAITTVDDGIVVQNNGNLVQINDGISDSGIINAKRISRPMILNDYVYWGAPVQENVLSQLPSGFDVSYDWNLTGAYDGYWAGLTSTTPGRGFITRISSAGVGAAQNFNFRGTPNNGVVTLYGDSYDGGVTQSSGNSILLGNPYPSAISAYSFVTDPANLNNIGGTLYFWTSYTQYTGGQYNTNDYATWNLSGATGVKASTDTSGTDDLKPTGKIASGQGFFAVLKADYNVTFNNSMRVRTLTDNTQFFRDAAPSADAGKIWLNLSNGAQAFRQLLVAYVDGATNGMDNLYDGTSFTANEVNFYSLVDANTLVIQGRATPFVDSDLVPLGMKITNAGDYTISLDNTEGLFGDTQDIYLEDLQLGIIHDLKSGPYNFNAAAGTSNNRFVLRYTNGTLNVPMPEIEKTVTVAVEKDLLSIRSVKENIASVAVFDVAGRRVFEQANINATEFSSSNLVLNHQALIVRITLADGRVTTRKILY